MQGQLANGTSSVSSMSYRELEVLRVSYLLGTFFTLLYWSQTWAVGIS